MKQLINELLSFQRFIGGRVSTLVIHAPKQTVESENKRSFEATMSSGVGDEYAIHENLVALLSPGCKVLLLSKDERKQAEGELVQLIPRSKTSNGIQRYDVHISHLKRVTYRGDEIKLNRCGVTVLR